MSRSNDIRSQSRRRMLVVSYAFPPVSAVGVFRPLKFVRYLRDCGWEPLVLTVRDGYSYSKDEALLDQVPEGCLVRRTPPVSLFGWWDKRTGAYDTDKPAAPGPGAGQTAGAGGGAARRGLRPLLGRVLREIRRWTTCPDTVNTWVPVGVWAGLDLRRRVDFDVVYATGPPHSTLLAGALISLLTRRPLVADFRDLWTRNESYEQRGIPRPVRAWDRLLERFVMRRAARVLTVTDSFRESLRDLEPDLPAHRFATITNGVDPADFEDLELPTARNPQFTLAHVGSLYGARNPAPLYRTLARWVERRPEVKCRFFGNTPGQAMPAPEVAPMVEFAGHVPHAEVLPRLWGADVLLILLGSEDNTRGVLPAKIFEYVCTGRPVLMYAPAGEASAFLERHGAGTTVSGDDPEAAVAFLDEAWLRWRESTGDRVSEVSIPADVDRRELTRRLASLCDDIVG